MRSRLELPLAALAILALSTPASPTPSIQLSWDPRGLHSDLPSWPSGSHWAVLYLQASPEIQPTGGRPALLAYDTEGQRAVSEQRGREVLVHGHRAHADRWRRGGWCGRFATRADARTESRVVLDGDLLVAPGPGPLPGGSALHQ